WESGVQVGNGADLPSSENGSRKSVVDPALAFSEWQLRDRGRGHHVAEVLGCRSVIQAPERRNCNSGRARRTLTRIRACVRPGVGDLHGIAPETPVDPRLQGIVFRRSQIAEILRVRGASKLLDQQ